VPTTPPAAAARPPLDAAALLRLALAYAVATNGTILMPLVVALLMRRFGSGEELATGVAGLEIAGIAVSCALLPHRIARHARACAAAGAFGAVLAQAASALLPTLAAVGAARVAAGLCEGMLFVVVAAGLAQRSGAERAWGVVILGAGIVDGALLLGLASLPPALADRWFFGLLAAVFVLVMVPVAQAGRGAVDSGAGRGARRRWRVLLPIWTAMVLAYGVLAAQWAVAEIVGRRIGLTPETSGLLLALASVAGIAGCLAASHRRSHAWRLPIVLAAQAVMAGSAAWFFASRGGFDFFASQLLITLAFYALTPFFSARLSALDGDGSLVAHSVVVCFVSVAVFTAAAGSLLARLGGTGFGLVLGGCALLAMAFARGAFGAEPAAAGAPAPELS